MILPLAVIVTIVGVLTQCAVMAADAPNACRLAIAVGLTRGYGVYSPRDEGPVLNTIYTPLSAVIYAPAGLADNPTQALLAGGLIATATTLVPLLALMRRSGGGGTIGLPQSDAIPPDNGFEIVAWLVATVAVVAIGLTETNLALTVVAIRADGPAVGLAALAAWIVLGASPQGLSRRRAMLAAALTVMALATKQVMLPVVPVLAAWIALTDPRGPARAALYIAGVAVGGVLAAAAAAALWGWDAMVFNVFTLPANHPWLPLPAVLVAGEIVHYCGPFVLVLAAATWASWPAVGALDQTDAPVAATPPPPSRLAIWLVAHPWALSAVMGLALLTTSGLSRIKVGGGNYNWGLANVYLLIAAAGALVALARARWHATHPPPDGALVRSCLAPGWLGSRDGTVALAWVMLLPVAALGVVTAADVKRLLRPEDNPSHQAYLYARDNPHRVWFPRHVLSSFLAEGQLYHFDYGLYDRALAGYPISGEHLRAHLPPNLEVIAYPPDALDFSFVDELLPEYDQLVDVPELPGWWCLARRPSPTLHPSQ